MRRFQVAAALLAALGMVAEATAEETEQKSRELDGEAYAAYWLVNEARGERDEYGPLLLLTRLPLKELHQYTGFRDWAKQLRGEELGDDGKKPTVVSARPIAVPLLDAPAIMVRTYRKDSIWNDDQRAIQHAGGITAYDESKRTIRIEGVAYRIEDATIEQAVHLLKHPEGTVPLHRRHGPLTGFKHTAKALSMLLELQRE